MHPRCHVERAMIYLSFFSPIYHTVADIQRSQFKACSLISDDMKKTYCILKITQPLDIGYPLSYWISYINNQMHQYPPSSKVSYYNTSSYDDIPKVIYCEKNQKYQNLPTV